MLNEDRIKTMTDLAIYESTDGEKEIRISGYNQKDYVGLNMLTTALWVTVGFFLIAGLVAVVFTEQIFAALTINNIIYYGIVIVAVYLVVLVTYLIAAYRLYSRRHRDARTNVKDYYGKLRRLERQYKKEAMALAKARELSDLEVQLEGDKS